MPKGKYLFLILAAVFLLTPAFFALAQFVGPSQTPPSGGGTLQVDTNYNVGLGTSSALITPTGGVSFGRLFTISSSSNPGFSLLTGTNRYAWYADTASGTLSLAGSTNGSGGNRVFQITPGGTVYGYDYHSINNQNYYVDPGMSLMPYSALFAGNVGIGTTAPMGRLDLETPGGTTSTSIIMGANGSPSYGKYSIIRTDNANGTGFATYDDRYAGSNTTWQRGDTGLGTVYLMNLSGSQPNGSVLSLYDGSNNVKVSLNTGGNSYFNGGNVGIGTASPSTLLDVNGLFTSRVASGVGAGDLIMQTGWIGNAGGYIDVYTDNVVRSQIGSYSGTNTYFNAGAGGYVGIGTSTPSTAGLVVTTNVSGVGIDVAGNRIANLGAPVNPNDAATKSYVDSSIASGVSAGVNGSTGYIAKFTGANTVGNSLVYDNGTSVGIGTTNPSVKLQVSGDISVSRISDNSATLLSTTTAVNDLGLYNTRSGFWTRIVTNSAPINFFTDGSSTNGYVGGTPMVTFNNNGYVGIGIGTAAPSTDLDVNGNVQSQTYYDRNNTNYYVEPSAAILPYSAVFAGSVGIGTTGPTSIVQINGGEGAPATSGNMNTGLILSHSMGGPALNIGVQNVGLGTSYGWLSSAYANNPGVYNYLVLQPNGGNVGIGTTGPGAKLDIEGVNNSDNLLVGTGWAGFGGAPAAAVNSDPFTKVSIGPYGEIGNAAYNAVFYIGVNAQLTTSNYSTLSVNKFSPHYNPGAGMVIAQSCGGCGDLGFWGINWNSTSTPQTFPNAFTSVMYLSHSGNVGVGTTNPSTAGLVVTSNVSTVGIDVSNNRIQNVGTPINASDAATKNYVDSAIVTGVSGGVSGTSGYIAKFTGANSVGNSEIYDTGSAVGIGTTGPGATLDVNGGIKSNSAYYLVATSAVERQFQNYNTVNGGWYFGNTSDGRFFLNGLTQTGAYKFGILTQVSSSSQNMYFAGNVGIDMNSAPGTNLDVNGNINVGYVLYDRSNANYYLNPSGNIMPYSLNTGGGINIGGGGTFSGSLAVNGSSVTLSSATQLILNSTSSAAIQMNQGSITGVYKLSVNTVDPVYNIGHVNYATYAPDIIGIKTEVFGKAELTAQNPKSQILNSKQAPNTNDQNSQNGLGFSASNLGFAGPLYGYVIDFNKVERGSDLWLFWQTINEGKDMKDISVYLTPDFAGQAWYTLEPAKKEIVIYAIPNDKFQIPNTSYEVSYHLVAPRYDSEKWTNYAPAGEQGTALPVR